MNIVERFNQIPKQIIKVFELDTFLEFYHAEKRHHNNSIIFFYVYVKFRSKFTASPEILKFSILTKIIKLILINSF